MRKIYRLTAERAFYTVTETLNIDGISLTQYDPRIHIVVDEAMQSMVAYLRVAIVALPDERIDIERAYPADWWQAVRERWLPPWWLQRYPVQLRRISIHESRYRAVCPHLPTDQPGDHLAWLVSQDTLPHTG